MNRARVVIRSAGHSVEQEDAVARTTVPDEPETLLAELVGGGFAGSLTCAGGAAIVALSGTVDDLVVYDRTACLALLTTVFIAGVHARGWRRAAVAAAVASSRLLWRHRAVLFALGIGCAVASQLWAQQSAAGGAASASALIFIGGLGALSASRDRMALALWIGATMGIPVALAFTANTVHADSAAWTLTACIVVILCLAALIQRMVLRAWRVRQDNDQLVAQLRQQVALVEAADTEKTRFLGAASHDLRQPMHALGLFVAALEKDLRGDAHHDKVISLTGAVDALEESFVAMLDLSMLDASLVRPNVQTFPIRDVFRRLHMQCSAQAEEKGLSLRFKPGGKLVTSDPQLLERILANLIHNSIRYTNEGGVIAVVRTRRGCISIEVWDTGVGIPADQVPLIFNEFYQVENQGRDRSKGLGMGLSIVKRLVLLLGYELEVASQPGRGTVFRLLAPQTQLEEMQSMVLGADTIPSAPDEGRTILLVDDEPAVRAAMNELLQSWGYTVLLAGTIDEARVVMLRHKGVIDVVVADLRLANGEDGLQAIEEVRRTYGAPLPAIVVTGDTTPAEVERAHAGGHPVLFKPVRSGDLFAALRHTS